MWRHDGVSVSGLLTKCHCIRFLKSDVYKDCIRAEMSGSSSGTGASAGCEPGGGAGHRWLSRRYRRYRLTTLLLQGVWHAQAAPDRFSENEEKEIDEFLGTLEQGPGSCSWPGSGLSWLGGHTRPGGGACLHPHTGYFPWPGHNRCHDQYRGVHQSPDLSPAGKAKPEADLIWRLHHGRCRGRGYAEAPWPLRRLRHPPLRRGQGRVENLVPARAAISQINRREGEPSRIVYIY